MAGDWIKMRTNLARDPHVLGIVRKMSASRPQNVGTPSTDVRDPSTLCRVIGSLHAVWSLFDEQSVDGVIAFYSPEIIDEMIQWSGFAKAMIDVGWLLYDGKALSMHNFTEHNGQSAKRRAMDAHRKREARLSTDCPQDVRTPSALRSKKPALEERREDREGGSTPEGLNELQYATRLMEEVGMPNTRNNLHMVAAGIKSEEGRGGLAQAYEYVLGQARSEVARNGSVTGFWFQDKKWAGKKSLAVPPPNLSIGKQREAELAKAKAAKK